MNSWRSLIVALAALFTLGGGALVDAISVATGPSAPAGAWAQEAAKAASVEGFRSARFGMTEADVRKALRKDFGIEDSEIEGSVNVVEKTTALEITVNDLLPGSGPARAGYIFGYRSKRLIQVNVVWGVLEPKPTTENLNATANILRGYFLGQGFAPDKVMTRTQLSDGSVIEFRGIDDKGRMALLVFINVPQEKGAARPGSIQPDPFEGVYALSSAPTRPALLLRLSYILNADNSDIFKIQKGNF